MNPDAKKPLRVILDPGHGGLRGDLPADPGAVGNGTTEAAQNLAVALACKYVLSEAGLTVSLTRVNECRPAWLARTSGMGRADLYVGIHHDMVGGRSMAYYAAGAHHAGGPDAEKSRGFARALDDMTPDPEFIVLPDTAARHGSLYIRGVLAPVAVLWEIDPVRIQTRADRLGRADQLLSAIQTAQRRGVLRM